jgi:uncharacterized protein
MFGLRRSSLFKVLIAIFFVVGIASLALIHFFPAPPSTITIATSLAGDHYQALGSRYQGILAGSDVEVQLRQTNGAKENLSLLNDPNSGVQIGFMQGGISNSRLAPDLLSLGRIDHQIFWLFYPAGDKLTDLTQLKGKRIALAAEGSGDRAVCEKILAVAGVNFDNTILLSHAPRDAVKALDDGTVDALFLNFSLDAPILHALLEGPQYRLMNITEAEALTRIFPYLVQLVLPRGTIDLGRKIPATDITLISTTNVVLVRKEIHPAIIDLLAQAISKAHSVPGFFQKVGDFPTLTDPEYPIAQSALDFYKNGPSLLNRYFPFWIVPHVQRLLAVLLAGGAIIYPLVSFAPKLFQWFVQDRMRKLYNRLRVVEKAMQPRLTAPQLVALQTDLENIDRMAGILPMRHSELFFSLKRDIDSTRTYLASRLVEARSQAVKVA